MWRKRKLSLLLSKSTCSCPFFCCLWSCILSKNNFDNQNYQVKISDLIILYDCYKGQHFPHVHSYISDKKTDRQKHGVSSQLRLSPTLIYCMLSSAGRGGLLLWMDPAIPSDTDMSQGALTWAWESKTSLWKLRHGFETEKSGVGLSQFQNRCQMSPVTADILKCHCSLPPSWTLCLLLLGREQPHSWSTSAPCRQERGPESVFIYSNQYRGQESSVQTGSWVQLRG